MTHLLITCLFPLESDHPGYSSQKEPREEWTLGKCFTQVCWVDTSCVLAQVSPRLMYQWIQTNNVPPEKIPVVTRGLRIKVSFHSTRVLAVYTEIAGVAWVEDTLSKGSVDQLPRYCALSGRHKTMLFIFEVRVLFKLTWLSSNKGRHLHYVLSRHWNSKAHHLCCSLVC